LSNAARNAKSANASKRKSRRLDAKPSSQRTPRNPLTTKQTLKLQNRTLTKKVIRKTTNQCVESSRVLAHSKCTRLRLRRRSQLPRRAKVRKPLRLRLLKLVQRALVVAEAAERASVDAVQNAREEANVVVVATSRWSGKRDQAHVRAKTRSKPLMLSKSKKLSPPKRKPSPNKPLQPLTKKTSTKILNPQLKKPLQRRVPQSRKRSQQQKRRRPNQLSKNLQLNSLSS